MSIIPFHQNKHIFAIVIASSPKRITTDIQDMKIQFNSWSTWLQFSSVWRFAKYWSYLACIRIVSFLFYFIFLFKLVIFRTGLIFHVYCIFIEIIYLFYLLCVCVSLSRFLIMIFSRESFFRIGFIFLKTFFTFFLFLFSLPTSEAHSH